jgi:hypothetical protein
LYPRTPGLKAQFFLCHNAGLEGPLFHGGKYSSDETGCMAEQQTKIRWPVNRGFQRSFGETWHFWNGNTIIHDVGGEWITLISDERRNAS